MDSDTSTASWRRSSSI